MRSLPCIRPGSWKIGHDLVRANGTVSLRHGARSNTSAGQSRTHREVICLVHGSHPTVITTTGDVLGEYTPSTLKMTTKQEHLNPRFRGLRCS